MAEQTYRVVWIGEEEIIASNSKQAKQIASKQLASTIDESELKIKKFKNKLPLSNFIKRNYFFKLDNCSKKRFWNSLNRI